MQVDFQKVLEGLGVKVESFDRLRLGRGVAGKVSYVAALAMVALIIVAFRASGSLLFATVAAIVLVFVAYLIGILLFAHQRPGLALLEGAELIQWRKMDMGVQGLELPPASPNVEPPRPIEGPR